MTSNREAANVMLAAASVAMAAVAGGAEAVATVGAVNAIGFALLDVADAIREQTEAHQTLATEAQ